MAFECRLTTIDNPYDPFDDFTMWYLYDVEKGYNSCAYLDRIAKTSDSLTDSENAVIIENAIDEIIKYDFLGVYMKVKRETEFDTYVGFEDTLTS